jgi:flagellar biosynthesis protein FlhG
VNGRSQIIAVGGGKGGVGKSVLSAHLAVALGQLGQRVLLIDADFGGANLHTLLGCPPPSLSLSDLLRKTAAFVDVVVPTGHPGVSLVGGAFDSIDVANMQHGQKQRLLRDLTRHFYDDQNTTLIVDLGAGTSFNTLDFFLSSDIGIVVALPEPTSVENAFRFVKAAFFRHLGTLEKSCGIEELMSLARAQRTPTLMMPGDVARAATAQVERDAPLWTSELRRHLALFRPQLVMNQLLPEDTHVIVDAATTSRRFLGVPLDVLGTIDHDGHVCRAVRMRQPLSVAAPQSPAWRDIVDIARKLLPAVGSPVVSMRGRVA